jgi:hypothetical protein
MLTKKKLLSEDSENLSPPAQWQAKQTVKVPGHFFSTTKMSTPKCIFSCFAKKLAKNKFLV